MAHPTLAPSEVIRWNIIEPAVKEVDHPVSPATSQASVVSHDNERPAALAIQLLHQVHDAHPALFPVESLNSSMVLAGIKAQRQDRVAAERILRQAVEYHDSVADDFEVRVNFRMRPWLDQALELAAQGDLDAILPYHFPY